jgi:hypothetical protein
MNSLIAKLTAYTELLFMYIKLKMFRMHKIEVKLTFIISMRGETGNESSLRRGHFASLVADLLQDIKKNSGQMQL